MGVFFIVVFMIDGKGWFIIVTFVQPSLFAFCLSWNCRYLRAKGSTFKSFHQVKRGAWFVILWSKALRINLFVSLIGEEHQSNQHQFQLIEEHSSSLNSDHDFFPTQVRMLRVCSACSI